MKTKKDKNLTCKLCSGKKFVREGDKWKCMKCGAKIKYDKGYSIYTKTLLISFAILLTIGLAYALTITQITPTGDITTSNSSVNIQYNLSTNFLNTLTWSWDNVNMTIYDSSLVLFYNFDNRSALGENDTHVKDLSMYGNNGTVVGGSNISWKPNGKYGGAFNFSGGVNYINVGTTLDGIINTSQRFTYSAWINPLNVVGAKYIVNLGGTGAGKSALYINSDKARIEVSNSTGAQTLTGNLYISSKWMFIVGVYNGTTISIYLDGVFDKSLDVGIINIVDSSNSIGGRASSNTFNGSIDDVMIFNKSLSASEISQLYKSQLTKYNSQNWTFLTNQTINNILNSTSSSYNWNYYLCSSNSTGSENCTTQKTITQTITVKTLITNFTTSVGNVRSDFYGINGHLGLTSGYLVFPTNDCTTNQTIDYVKSRQSFLNTGMNTIRESIDLGVIFPTDSVIQGTNYDAEFVKWAYENNIKIVYTINSVPTWLQNKTSGYCNSTRWSSCSPLNYTRFAELHVEAIDNITNNGLYLSAIKVIEIGNEPYAQYWLNNASQLIKATEYLIWYNSTYDAIKLSYPTLKIYGEVMHIDYPIMGTTFLSNMTTKMDGVSLHNYYGFANGFNNIFNATNWTINLCNTYGANCSEILLSEWNLGRNSGYSHTLFHRASFGNSYLDILNNFPSNYSLQSYTWVSDINDYFNLSCESGNKQRDYAMYSEFGTSVISDDIYNVTKNFAHLCPAGGTVYQSSSDDSTLKTVSCKDGDKFNTIVINTDTSSKNVTGNIYSTINYVMDTSNGNLYETNQDTSLGIKDSYDVTYLTTLNFTISEDSGFTKSAVTGESYTSSEVRFTTSSNTEKHIASDLSKSITANVQIDLTKDCSSVKKITYTPNGNTPSIYLDNDARTLCISLTTTGKELTINPSSESNVIQIEYKTTELATSVLKITIGFIALCVLLFVIFGFGKLIKDRFSELEFKDFVKYSIGVLIFTIMAIMLINFILEAI